MICPQTAGVVKVHSPKKKGVLFKCPLCGAMHRSIAITEETRTGLSKEQLASRQEAAAKPNLNSLKPAVREAIQSNLQPGETVEVLLVGEWNQTLVATSKRAFIFKKGLMTGSFFRKQATSWDFRNISGIELHRSMTMAAVVIQVPGVAPVTEIGRLSKGPNSVWEAPNAVVVNSAASAEPLVARLRELIAQAQSPTSSVPANDRPDAIEQIRKLAELRDAGILSEAEFEAKKRQLLERI
jgi:hypothetical protein